MRDANLTPTGRELKDPAATLVECVDPEGLKHTVIAFDEAFRGHPALTTGVDLIMSFMAYPMVTGLVECSAADTRRARFAYPTGTIWTLKEIVRGFEQVGQQVGMRAALELCYLAGMVLHEGGETGPLQGCFSHGNLTPWRIGIKGDGQLQVFGYGLAQVEMDLFLKGELEHLPLDSIRYAPPERLEGQPEQPSSDIYSLAVIAYELIVGKPLFDETDSARMLESVKLAEGVQRIGGAKNLPRNVQDVLGSAVVYDPDRRLQGQDFIDAVGTLLDDPSIQGRTLIEVMDRMGNQTARSKRKLVKAATSAFTAQDLAALAAQDDDDEVTEAVDPSESRWASLKGEATTGRRARRQAVAGKASRKAGKPRQTRRNPKEQEKVTAPPPPPPVATSITPASEEPEPRRRRRKRTEASEPTETSASVTASTESEEAPRRRRRRKKGGDAPKPVDTQTKTTPEPSQAPAVEEDTASDTANVPSPDTEEETPRRRRRRRTSSEEPPGVKPGEVESEENTPRRRRRRPQAAEQPSEAVPEPTAAPAEAPRRRRRRRPTDTEE